MPIKSVLRKLGAEKSSHYPVNNTTVIPCSILPSLSDRRGSVAAATSDLGKVRLGGGIGVGDSEAFAARDDAADPLVVVWDVSEKLGAGLGGS